MARPERVDAAVSPWTRWFVRIFLAAFIVCGILRIEAWPFTGFRLFSTLRGERQTTWVAQTVSRGGRAATLWFGDLPPAYHGFYLIMPRFRRLPLAKQQAVCTTWLREARRVRPGTVRLVIRRERWRALPRRGDRPPPPRHSEIEFAC